LYPVHHANATCVFLDISIVGSRYISGGHLFILLIEAATGEAASSSTSGGNRYGGYGILKSDEEDTDGNESMIVRLICQMEIEIQNYSLYFNLHHRVRHMGITHHYDLIVISNAFN
jgi:hypothetical protein